MAVSRPIGPLKFAALFYLLLALVNVAAHFPYAADRQTAASRDKAAAEFYRLAYAPPTSPTPEDQEQEEAYVTIGQQEAKNFGVEDMVRGFVADNRLQDKRVLDIGAGRGYLQDLVTDYVGLDISTTAARYFHKPFVLASATAMPFRDNEFDAAWSIWVLEHIPNPESALLEMRRVVKPGGVILLMPAWFCTSWAADGYKVRPYSDFGLAGRINKASLPFRESIWYQLSYVVPVRGLRLLASKVEPGPTSFHYNRLTPNYKKYWQPDSDAANSMDPNEAVLWFESRGDRCLNCATGLKELTAPSRPLVIRIGPKS